VSRVRTYRDLIARTAHLCGKGWFADTNWSSFLYGVLNSNGWPQDVQRRERINTTLAGGEN
jgi:hypothetical protein